MNDVNEDIIKKTIIIPSQNKHEFLVKTLKDEVFLFTCAHQQEEGAAHGRQRQSKDHVGVVEARLWVGTPSGGQAIDTVTEEEPAG